MMRRGLFAFPSRGKELAPVAISQEAENPTKTLLEEINRLRPQLSETHNRLDYRSQGLAASLLEKANDPNFPELRHVIEPLQLSAEDTIGVRLDDPPADPADGGGEVSLFNALKGYMSIRFDLGYQTTHVERMKAVEGEKGRTRAMDPGNLQITYPDYLKDLLVVIKDDLEDGRKRWIDTLQEAQRNYFSQLRSGLGEWGEALGINFMNTYRRAFRNNDRFLVFGIPLEEETDGEKKPVIRLLTTLPVTLSTADRLAQDGRIPLPQETTGEYRKRYWGGLQTRESYVERSHGITIVVDTIDPSLENFEMISGYDADELKDGTRLEKHFAEFLGGFEPSFFSRLGKEKQPTLLIVHPNTSPVGPYLDL